MQHPSDDELAAYSASRSSSGEAMRIEQHLLQCARCRDVVTIGMLVRQERKPRSAPRRTGFAIPAVTLLAAAAAVIWIRSSNNGASLRLGDVIAPAYNSVEVRGASIPGDSLFRSGMRAYTKGDYTRASRELEDARAKGADSVAATFFIAASALMRGHAQLAASEFARSGKVQSPYQAESEYYRGKAFIRMRQFDSAGASLRAASSFDNAIAEPARALLDSLEGVSGGR